MTNEQTTIESSDGLSLEAEVDAPDDARRAVVICHPHPKLGGTMNAPLLLALRDRLVAEDWAVVRFNFRGIGASEGAASAGEAEVADVEGALTWTRARYGALRVAVCGWSFGAAVALRAVCAGAEPAAVAAIAPAVKPRAGITVGLPPPDEVEVDLPVLLLCACNDDLVAVDDCRSWARTAGVDLEEVPGANHFFWGKYEDLAAIVTRWLDNNT